MAEKTRRGVRQPGSLPVSRDRILRAAIGIADQHGVGAVTMRAVASRLGVQAMALYNHVANKKDILDGMVDLVVEQFDLPRDEDDWREAMRRRAVSARRVFGRHRWAPLLIDSRESSGPSALCYFEWVLATLLRAGFSLDTAARAFSLLDSYIYGFGIQQSNLSAGGDAPPEERAEAMLALLPADQYPYLRLMASHGMQVGYDAETDFDFGLEIILDGIERILEESRPGGARSRQLPRVSRDTTGSGPAV